MGMSLLVILLAAVGITLVGLTALVMGIVALVRISRSDGALRGRGLAVAAVILGGLMVVIPPLLLLGGCLIS
jgi:hypothetical protein